MEPGRCCYPASRQPRTQRAASLGDLFDRQVQYIVQQQNGALVHRHPAQHLGDTHRLRRELGLRALSIQAQQSRSTSAQPPDLADGKVDRHPAHPQFRHVIGLDPGSAVQGPDERFLHDVLGLLESAGDREQLTAQPRVRRLVELLEARQVGLSPSATIACTFYSAGAHRGGLHALLSGSQRQPRKLRRSGWRSRRQPVVRPRTRSPRPTSWSAS